MKLKLPPPLILLICMALMFAAHMWSPFLKFNFSARKLVAYCILIVAITIAVSSILQFRKAKTTTNPFQPEKADKLVTSGWFQLSRNPMYLSLCLVLIAWGVALANATCFLVIPLFIWYMNEFQIKPEEAAMHKLFGEEYVAYSNKVRRWL